MTVERDLTSADWVEGIRFWVENINGPSAPDRIVVLRMIVAMASSAIQAEASNQ